MFFADLEADVALEAMSPRMQKLLKTRRQKAKWVSGTGNCRRVRKTHQKIATLTVIEDPSPLDAWHHSAAAKRKLAGQQCQSVYSMSRSPSPCASSRRGVDDVRNMVRSHDDDVKIVGYLQLPLLSNAGDVRKGKLEEKDKERLTTKMTTVLPPISGATLGDAEAVGMGIARNPRHRKPRFANEEEGGVDHPFKKVRSILRHELSLLKSRVEVEEECRLARLALKSITTLKPPGEDIGKIAKCMRGFLLTHLPNATEHVRMTSLLALLDSEEQQRMSGLGVEKRIREVAPSKLHSDSVDLPTKAISFQPTPPATERSHKQAPRQNNIKSVATPTPQQDAQVNKNTRRKSVEATGLSSTSAQQTQKTPVKPDAISSSSQHSSPSDSQSAPRERVQLHKQKSVFRISTESGALAELGKDGKDGKASEYGSVHRRDVEACFKKFMDDGCIHHDDMMKALETLGFLPRQDWVDEVYGQMSKFALIRWEQFEKFVKNYAARQLEAFRDAFYAFDKDCSGRIDMDELANLLRTFDIEPMAYVLQEVIREVDPHNSQVLDLRKFLNVMNIVTSREGFSLSEYNNLIDAFRKFDVDASGGISKHEFTGLLLYLGLGTTLETIETLLKQFDCETGQEDSEQCMGERQFLRCVKKARDVDLSTVKLAIEANDADGSGTLSSDELQDVFQALGYYPSQAAIADASSHIGLNVDSELDPSQFWQLLQVLRSREGFSNAETSDAKETFKRYSSLDFISGPDLDVALRYMSYVVTFERQQALSYQVDLDMSGQLDYYEFRKLLRICRDQDIAELKRLFDLDRSRNTAGLLRKAEAAALLAKMGFQDLNGEPPTLTDEDIHPSRRGHEFCVNMFDLVQALIKLSWCRRKYAREHCGFSFKEVSEYKNIFRAADEANSGELNSGQIVSLLDSLFPEMSSDPAVRQQLVQVIKDADLNGNSHLDIKDFLRLMRTCSDMQIKARFDKERRAIQETEFSPAEINEFRHVFLSSDVNNDQELSLTEFRKMISSICPMGDRNTKLLSTIFHRITNRQCNVEGRHDHADFPEFLWLWHHLLETNFGGIRENTATKKRESISFKRRSSRVAIATQS